MRDESVHGTRGYRSRLDFCESCIWHGGVCRIQRVGYGEYCNNAGLTHLCLSPFQARAKLRNARYLSCCRSVTGGSNMAAIFDVRLALNFLLLNLPLLTCP